MANNRYYLKCPVCKAELFMGKSLGQGIYNTRGYGMKPEGATHFLPTDSESDAGDAQVLNEIYDFMWKHMLECHKEEWKGGKLFDVVSEYKEKESLFRRFIKKFL